MAAKQRDMSDSMHYESRQIRDALAASNARLKSARSGRLAPDLQPQVGAAMLQEWEGLAGMGTLDQGDTLAAENPLYQQMRSALLAFESEMGYGAPARERAFFSALRTQLMEAGAQPDVEQRNMQIAATHKWFAKHQPQGPEADPVTAAVLASSLAVETAGAPTQADTRPSLNGTPSVTQMRLSAAGHQQPALQPAVAAAGAAAAGPLSSSPAAVIGNKHFYFDVYSRAQVVSSGAAAAAAAAAAATGGGAAGSALRPTSARGPSPTMRGPVGRPGGALGDDAASLSVNHPLAMYPSVAGGVPLRGSAPASPATAGAAAAAAAAIPAGPPRARFANSEMYAPAKLTRSQELDELDHRAAQVAAAAAAAGVGTSGASGGGGGGPPPLHSRPWVNGPHKTPVGKFGGGGPLGGDGPGPYVPRGAAPGARHMAAPAPEEEEEVRVLRGKWSAMETRTNQAVSDVQSKVAEWSLQRARLEEEMVRRLEAGRIAPLNGNPGGGAAGGHSVPWQIDGLRRSDVDDGFIMPGTLSPYANANADLAAATAAAAAAPGALGFMMPTGGLHGAAAAAMGQSMRMRHADVGSYDRGRAELMDRLAMLGLNVSGSTLDRALRPLEDRPFLDCIARLPRPGENLVSRPDSVRVPAAKKKRSKSAAKKRPTSGR